MNKDQNTITPKQANLLSNFIVDALYNESANILHKVCEGFGLTAGTSSEAFKSKRNYINARLRHFKPNEIYDLARRMEGKYPFSKLDSYLNNLYDAEELNIVSKFSDIQNTIIQEIRKANYIIWVAVAWFTNNKLANELFLKSREGINIQIIVCDDEINRTFAMKLEKHFEVILQDQVSFQIKGFGETNKVDILNEMTKSKRNKYSLNLIEKIFDLRSLLKALSSGNPYEKYDALFAREYDRLNVFKFIRKRIFKIEELIKYCD